VKAKIDYTVDLVLQAGENIKRLMNENISIETKANNSDFVTNVDKSTEVFLVEGIKGTFPNQDFLTEENTTPRVDSEDLWIIDPIDGTTNFIYQKKNFAISIAYYHREKPVFGIVYDVMADKMFLGITGKGSYLNGEKLEKVNQKRTLSESILYGDLYSLSMFEKSPKDLRNELVSHRYLGAASLEICAVAENQAQAYISRNLKVWDVAAGVIILNEVGGSYYFGGHDNALFFDDSDGVFLSSQNKNIENDIKSLMREKVLFELNN